MTTSTFRPTAQEIKNRADAIGAAAARQQLISEHAEKVRLNQEAEFRLYQEARRLQAEAVARLSDLPPLYAARAEAGQAVVEAVRAFVAVEAQVASSVSQALAPLPTSALGDVHDQRERDTRLAELRVEAGLPANHAEDGVAVPSDSGGITGLTVVRAILRRHLGAGWLVAGDTQVGLVTR